MNRSPKTKRGSVLIGLAAALVVFANLGTHAAVGAPLATNVVCVNPGGSHSSTKPTGPNPSDVQETFTCTATAVAGTTSTPVPNQTIDGEDLNGLNDTDSATEGNAPDYSCVTGGNGTCSMTVPSASPTVPVSAGTGDFCFWIDQNSDKVAPQDCTSSTPPANLDVTHVSWAARVVSSLKFTPADPLDDAVSISPTAVEKIHVIAKDQFGSGFGNTDVDMFIVGGPNRGSSQTVAYHCTTAQDGTCEIDYTPSSFNGIDHVCVWVDANNTDSYLPSGPVDRGGSCLKLATGHTVGDQLTDAGRVTLSGGTPVASDLVVSPKTTPNDTVSTGSPYSLSATVSDGDGNKMANQVVNFEITGVADPDPNDAAWSVDRSCTTDANGTCSLTGAPGAQGSATTFTSSTAGLSIVRAWVAGQPIDPLEGLDPAAQPGLTIEPNTTEIASVHFGKIGTTIGTVVSGQNTGVYGFSPVIQGSLVDDETNPVSGGSVVLYRRYIGGSFQAVTSTTTSDQGTYSFQDAAPTGIADYQVQYIGDNAHVPSTGPTVRTWVRVGSIFNVSRMFVAAGHAVGLSGRILPEHSGKRVTLQWFQGNQGVWANVKTVTLDRNSAFNFAFTRSGRGYLIFRIIYWKQDALDLGNASRILKVTWQ